MPVRRPLLTVTGAAAVLGTLGYGGYVGLVTGRVTIDLGVGRRLRPLGPRVVDIQAPPGVVYDAVRAPYAERRPRAVQEKVRILGRTDDTVLAAHHTPVGRRLTAVTVETVTFAPPHCVDFRLMRGPVPHVEETFTIEPTSTGTRLTYTGELGTDLGRVGAWWGDLVAETWVRTVEAALATIKTESEQRAR